MQNQPMKFMTINELRPSPENCVNTVFIVLERGNATKMQENTYVAVALVADQTASVHFQLWNDEIEAFHPGDIIRLHNGIFSFVQGVAILRPGRKGRFEKIGEFTMLFVEQPNMSEMQWTKSTGAGAQQSVLRDPGMQ